MYVILVSIYRAHIERYYDKSPGSGFKNGKLMTQCKKQCSAKENIWAWNLNIEHNHCSVCTISSKNDINGIGKTRN